MADTLELLSRIFYAAASAAFLAAVVLWFRLKIPQTISDLTGRSARKSIAEVRARNEGGGVKSYRPSKVNLARGKLTRDFMSKQEGETTEELPQGGRRPDTVLLSENEGTQAAETTPLAGGNAPTMQLHDQADANPETEKLDPRTQKLRPETEKLDPKTQQLGRAPQTPDTVLLDPSPARQQEGKQLQILEEILLVHTDEVLP